MTAAPSPQGIDVDEACALLTKWSLPGRSGGRDPQWLRYLQMRDLIERQANCIKELESRDGDCRGSPASPEATARLAVGETAATTSSELVEKVAKCIDPEEGYWQHFVEAAEKIIPIVSRQANEKMLGEMADWERERQRSPSETLAEVFAREHGLTIPNEEKEDACT